MRTKVMQSVCRVSLLLLLCCTLLVLTASAAQDKFKLKPGATGKLCTTCHTDFQEKLKNPYVHTPVKSGDCTGCHNPHASSHGKMLAADPSKICYNCHGAVIPGNAQSTHKVVVEGNCVKCHDPHAAKNKFNLLKAGNDLCYECHKTVKDAVAKVKFKHSPVEKGCLNCHNPHASAKAASLLKDKVPALCLQCHKTDKPSFVSQHMKYPVARGRCTTCHSAHGSDKGGILYNVTHRPVANKQCSQCHDEPTSQTPFALKKTGFELCRGCHASTINEIFNKSRIHWPAFTREGCLTCHSPHGSAEATLLKENPLVLCARCHSDSIERQRKSPTKHPPVLEGTCSVCHSPHASDQPFYFTQTSVVELCGSCHDWQKHQTHPIGDKFRDGRNKNLSVNCLSCHRSHGTEYKAMNYFPTQNDLCTQCHIQYKR